MKKRSIKIFTKLGVLSCLTMACVMPVRADSPFGPPGPLGAPDGMVTFIGDIGGSQFQVEPERFAYRNNGAARMGLSYNGTADKLRGLGFGFFDYGFSLSALHLGQTTDMNNIGRVITFTSPGSDVPWVRVSFNSNGPIYSEIGPEVTNNIMTHFATLKGAQLTWRPSSGYQVKPEGGMLFLYTHAYDPMPRLLTMTVKYN